MHRASSSTNRFIGDRRRTWRWRGVLLIVAALSSVGLSPSGAAPVQDPPPAEAPAPAPFAVQPSGPDGPGSRDYFVYSLRPGETFGDTVAVSNLGDRPIDFVIYPADAFNVPDEGGFTAARDGEPSTDVGSWITLAASTYTVQPGQRIDVPFSITIPEDAEPGDHAGAILATDAALGSTTDPVEDPTLQVRQRVGARVYVRVEGPISPGLRIDALDVQHESPSFAVPFFSRPGKATITWEVSNTGNVRLTPTAQLEIKGLFGRTIRTLPAEELPELLPGSNIIRSASIQDLPPLEQITVELTVTADEVEVVGTSSYWAVPWMFVGLVALILLAALTVRWWRRRRRVPNVTPPGASVREVVHA